MPNLILGSASPRRFELLSQLGVQFDVCPADVDEDQITIADPGENVLARARLKAEALQNRFERGTLILTADTTVAYGGTILNKPVDEIDAARMLKLLSGKTHQVFTGMVLVDHQGKKHERLAKSEVVMRAYSEQESLDYIATGDPMDKAGSYAIQHAGFHPVHSINQCFAGIMGLGLCELYPLLLNAGVPMAADVESRFQVGESNRLCHYCQTRFNENLN